MIDKIKDSDIREVDADKVTQGVFNKAVRFLEHIQQLEILCSESSINTDFDLWYRALSAWFNKISAKLKKDQEAKYEALALEIDKVEPYINDDMIPDAFKKKILNKIQRELEYWTDKLGYQMPEHEGDDETDKDFA